MTSNHQRNLKGMSAAPRCQALRKDGIPCLSPAVRGQKRCHVHGGKGSEAKSYSQKLADMTRAMRERDRQTSIGIKGLDRLIRKLERKGAGKLAADARKIRRAFLDTTQYKDADLAAIYAPPPGEREAAQNEAALRAWISQYQSVDRQSFEMVRDRAMGAMLGLAVGEALGVTPDGWPRDSYRELGDMHGGGAFDLQPGQWAGDTAMALALMESLTCRRGLDETDFMERLLEWVEDGVYTCTGRCIGIDETTRRALVSYQETENPVAGDRHPDNLGSGSLVRLAPVAIRYWADRTGLRDAAVRQSRTTHGGPGEVDACLAFAEVLGDAIRGASRIAVLGPRYVPGASSVDRIMQGSWKNRVREAIRSDGNVLNALEAAIWCVDRSETFDEAVLLAVNLGGETARTAALAGQLAGAFYGACTIRRSWLERLAKRDHICEQVDRLFKQSGPRKGRSG